MNDFFIRYFAPRFIRKKRFQKWLDWVFDRPYIVDVIIDPKERESLDVLVQGQKDYWRL